VKPWATVATNIRKARSDRSGGQPRLRSCRHLTLPSERGGPRAVAPRAEDLKRVARAAGLTLPGAVLNLEAGFDSKTTRKSEVWTHL